MSRIRQAQSLATRTPGGTAAASIPGRPGSFAGVASASPARGGSTVRGSGVRTEGASAALSVTDTPYAAGPAFRGSDPAQPGRGRSVRVCRPRGTRPAPLTRACCVRSAHECTRRVRPPHHRRHRLDGLARRARRPRPRRPGRRASGCSSATCPARPSCPGAEPLAVPPMRDRDRAEAALDGVETLFMVSAAENGTASPSTARSSTRPRPRGCGTSSTCRSSARRPTRRSRSRATTRRPSSTSATPAWRGRSCATTSTSSSSTRWSGTTA